MITYILVNEVTTICEVILPKIIKPKLDQPIDATRNLEELQGQRNPWTTQRGCQRETHGVRNYECPPFSFTFKFYFIWQLPKFIILIFKGYGTTAEMHKYNIHLEIKYNKVNMTPYKNSRTLYINSRFGHSSPSHFFSGNGWDWLGDCSQGTQWDWFSL